MAEHPSLNIIFEQIKARITAQDAQISSLDGKANFGLASATLLTAGLASLKGSITTAQQAAQINDLSLLGWAISPATIVNWFTAISAALYVIVVFTAYKAYQVRDFKVAPEPEPLLEDYLDQPEELTKSVLTETFAAVFHQNERLVDNKAFWVAWVLRSLLIEAFLLLALTIVQLSI